MGQQVAVVGAGLMGSGIAQVAAVAGWDVVMRDISEEALARAVSAIEASTAKLAGKGALTEGARAAVLDRISTTTDLAALGAADLVIEAVYEKIEVKHEIFRALDDVCRPDAVLATNTSAIPITSIAAVTRSPERVVGTHFFSPVPLMALCELVRGRRTSDEALATARAFAEQVGKTCIVVERDVAGFVTTRLFASLAMEAVRLYESGVASADDIDAACRLGFGHPMGPLATADLTGIDVLRNATLNIWRETALGSFFPPETLTRMVAAGELGAKAGHGFYRYDG